jgi:phytoene dehydrogenase-like protein
LLLRRSLEETARGLGREGGAWRTFLEPYLAASRALFDEILKPIRIPRHPVLMLRFAEEALRSCEGLLERRFDGPRARALFSGCAAHSVLPLDAAGSASFGLVLALAAHAVGWPCARGGSQRIADALAARFTSLGGEIRTGVEVRSLGDLPDSRAVLDVTPRQLARIAASALPSRYLGKLERFRYGPGVFKLDWALDGPIPWRDPACLEAATVHVGGPHEQIAAAEAEVARGGHPERPFVIAAQQSLFDPRRAPAGKHTAWGYCHVPNGSTVDMTERIERQIERFAPGFRDLVLARSARGPADLERHNPNLVGGDIGGGANDLAQVLLRPVARFDPYATPNEKLFLCSSSTPPGGGVHGMCGQGAARSVLRRPGAVQAQEQ